MVFENKYIGIFFKSCIHSSFFFNFGSFVQVLNFNKFHGIKSCMDRKPVFDSLLTKNINDTEKENEIKKI